MEGEAPPAPLRTLVVYTFHEWSAHVECFLRTAVYYKTGTNPARQTDFVVVFNDPSHDNLAPLPNDDMRRRILAIAPSVHVQVRANTGFDFGAWSCALFAEDNDDDDDDEDKDEDHQDDDVAAVRGQRRRQRRFERYDSFVFANSSVVGPFLDGKKYPGKTRDNWAEIYTEPVENPGSHGNVRLFGSTINCAHYSKPGIVPSEHAHVQSYIFAMTRETLLFLMHKEIFSPTTFPATFPSAVLDYEIRMSREVIDAGWNIGCTHFLYRGVDFAALAAAAAAAAAARHDQNSTTHQGMISLKENSRFFFDDVVYPKMYRSNLLNEFDAVFLKGNRGIDFRMI